MLSRLRIALSPLLLGLLASCTGAIGEANGNPGSEPAAAAPARERPAPAPSGVGGATGSAGAGAAPGSTLDGAPIYSRYVRLTHEQWENSVRDLLQLPALPGLSATFTGDPPGSNFSNNERRLFMTSGLWSDYETAAETLSQQVARDADRAVAGHRRHHGRRDVHPQLRPARLPARPDRRRGDDATARCSRRARRSSPAATRSRTACSWSSRRCCSRRTSSTGRSAAPPGSR